MKDTIWSFARLQAIHKLVVMRQTCAIVKNWKQHYVFETVWLCILLLSHHPIPTTCLLWHCNFLNDERFAMQDNIKEKNLNQNSTIILKADKILSIFLINILLKLKKLYYRNISKLKITISVYSNNILNEVLCHVSFKAQKIILHEFKENFTDSILNQTLLATICKSQLENWKHTCKRKINIWK